MNTEHHDGQRKVFHSWFPFPRDLFVVDFFKHRVSSIIEKLNGAENLDA